MSRARVLTVRGVVASFLVVRWATIPRPVVFVCVASLGFFVFSNSVQGQDLFEIWSPLGDDLLWTNDDNWVDDQGNLSGAPSLSFESGGQINGGTVIIDSDVDAAGVIQNGGAIEIQSGSLTSDASENQTGVTRFNGEVILSAGTKLTGPDVTLGGVTRFLGSTAAIETKGDLSMRGELHLAIDGDGTSSIEVGGEANLRGPVFPNFSGVSPAFGDSFQFLSGATAVNISSGAAVVLPETVVLGRGLEARVEADGGNASVVIGNLPVLQVDRVTGDAKIMNVVGGDLSMTGYNITSQLGLLNPAAFAGSGAEGFVTPNPIATAVSEFSLVGIQTLAVGDSVGIGGAYNGGATHPRDEDVRFQFSTTTGQVLQGLVEYVGPANDVVLNVNPDTGEATVYHLSTHLDPVDLTGYHITSASGSLVAANWSSLVKSGAGGEGWTEANPTANAISELNLQSKSVLSNGTVISLGNIFDPLGIADIQFEFTTEDAVLMGTVTYGQVPVVAGCAPVNSLLGDLNGNGTVDFDDFVALSNNFGNAVNDYASGDIDCSGTVDFDDFVALSNNFGTSLNGAAAAVPEPNGLTLFCFAASLLTFRRGRKRMNAGYPVVMAAALAGLVTFSSAKPSHAQMDILAGQVLPIRGPDDIQGLKNPDSIQYAVNVWGEADRLVRGVDFWSDRDPARPELDGYSTDFTHDVTNWENKPEFGDTLDDDELEEVMSDIRWTNNSPGNEFGVGVHMEVTALTEYTLELLISGNHDENRRWDIWIDEEKVVDEFQSNAEEPWDPGTAWAYNHTFVATDNELNVTFTQGETGSDGNAILQGLVLSVAGETVTAGDFNEDGQINLNDFSIMAQNFGLTFESASISRTKGDFDFDTRVNLFDFLGFRQLFNSQGAAAAIPEPNGLVTLGLGIGMVLVFGRKRKLTSKPRSQLALVVMAVGLLSTTETTYAQMDIIRGEVLPITGPADIQGLKDPGSVVYAVNVWGEADRVIRGVDFWSDRDPDRPELDGYSTDFTHDVTNWQNKPEFGDTVDDDEFEELMSDIRWTDNSPGNAFGVGVHMDVVPSNEYVLELLISGNHDEDRVWDIWIDEEQAVDEFQSNADEPYDQGIVWAYTLNFAATDDQLNVTFTQGATGSDGNAILQGLVLSLASEGTLPGDFNDDGAVNLSDFQILVENYHTDVDFGASGDINFSGRVDFLDFVEFRQAFTAAAGAPQGAAIPEPNTAWLGAIAAIFGIHLLRRRGRRSPL